MSFSGDEGAVKAGGTSLDITGWSSNTQPKSTYDDTSCGDSGSQWIASAIMDSSVTIKYKPTSVADAINAGTEVVLDLYPKGSGAGSEKISCSALCESKAIDVSLGSLVVVSQTFKVNGALTESTET